MRKASCNERLGLELTFNLRYGGEHKRLDSALGRKRPESGVSTVGLDSTSIGMSNLSP